MQVGSAFWSMSPPPCRPPLVMSNPSCETEVGRPKHASKVNGANARRCLNLCEPARVHRIIPAFWACGVRAARPEQGFVCIRRGWLEALLLKPFLTGMHMSKCHRMILGGMNSSCFRSSVVSLFTLCAKVETSAVLKSLLAYLLDCHHRPIYEELRTSLCKSTPSRTRRPRVTGCSFPISTCGGTIHSFRERHRHHRSRWSRKVMHLPPCAPSSGHAIGRDVHRRDTFRASTGRPVSRVLLGRIRMRQSCLRPGREDMIQRPICTKSRSTALVLISLICCTDRHMQCMCDRLYITSRLDRFRYVARLSALAGT